MDFFKLPPETRLKIYTYLLVKENEVLVRCTTSGSHWVTDEGLHPQLLLTNKRILHEAAPLLYSKNKIALLEVPVHVFEFADPGSGQTIVAPFLRRIGSQACLVCHIVLKLWTFERGLSRSNETTNLDKLDRENIQAIQTLCPGIAKVEFRLCDQNLNAHSLWKYPEPPETQLQLQRLASELEVMPKATKIILNIEVSVDTDDQDMVDEGNGVGEVTLAIGNSYHRRSDIDEMEKTALSYGWAVEMQWVKRRTRDTADSQRGIWVTKYSAEYWDMVDEGRLDDHDIENE